MAKVLVQHDTDPGICVILAKTDTGGWFGECTQCGTVFTGGPRTSVQAAKEHVDEHEDAR